MNGTVDTSAAAAANVAQRLTANMAFAITGRVASALMGLAVTALVTRHLGAELFGVYRTASAWAVLSCTFASLGLSIVCLRQISEPGANITKIVGTSLVLRLVTAAVSIALVALVFLKVPVSGGGDLGHFSKAVAIAGLGTMGTLGNELITTIFQSALAQRRSTIAELIGGAFTLVLTVLAIYLHGGLLVLIGAASGGLIATFLVSAVLAKSIAPVRLQFDPALARTLLVLGAPLLLSDIVGMATLRLDTVMLSLMSSPAEVGYYSVANKLREVAVKLPYLFAAFLLPVLVRALSDTKEFDKRLGNGLVASWIFAVSVMLVMGCFGDVLVDLLAGPDFLPGASVVAITGIALAAGSLAAVLQTAVVARLPSITVFKAHVWSAITAIAGYGLLIRPWGAAGTAIAVAVGELAFTVRLMWLASPSGLRGLPWKRLMGIAVVGAFSATLIFGLRARGFGLPWAIATAALVYPALLLMSGILTRKQLMQLIGRGGAASRDVSSE